MHAGEEFKNPEGIAIARRISGLEEILETANMPAFIKEVIIDYLENKASLALEGQIGERERLRIQFQNDYEYLSKLYKDLKEISKETYSKGNQVLSRYSKRYLADKLMEKNGEFRVNEELLSGEYIEGYINFLKRNGELGIARFYSLD